MTTDFSAGPFTRALWQQAADVVQRIESLPFLDELVGGQLAPEAFVLYIVQDSLYLNGYGRAMALLAAKAPSVDHTQFWVESVGGAIAAEQELHKDLLADNHLAAACRSLQNVIAKPTASPTTLGYTSYLLAGAACHSYAIGVAGVLPCFWVYAHVGKLLAEKGKNVAASHPYKAWIDCYDDAAFADATRHAVAVLEECAANATAAEKCLMQEAFQQACVYEWHFWHAAYIQQDWALPQ